ncbi:hypothetical protein EZV62_023956 [Acer yangbiense]|uniref:Retroviral polymerase SH3-like domain-containing protein n=1 Tax=Acer yangbiense TaxID=1000413 RepID=A0A5C7H4S1_9ROSI|nr:hypothetical protein EZV62_023956 [Acer yangbiense]
MSKHDMVRDMQAISHAYDLCDACQLGDVHKIEGLCSSCQIGKLQRKSNMNEVFDGDSSNESVMNDGAVAKSDSLILKTRSSADVYDKCNMMVNEPACNKEAAQMDVRKLAMEEELIMMNASTPNKAKWIGKVLTDLNYVQEKPTGLWCYNSAISMAKNHFQHGRTKHINFKFHAIREAEKNANKMDSGSANRTRPGVTPFSSYATVNSSIWHVKLGNPAPLILQKMLHHIHFNKKFVVLYPLHRGYRCLHPSGKVYVSRNVEFNELEFPFQSLFPSKSVSSSCPQSSSIPFSIVQEVLSTIPTNVAAPNAVTRPVTQVPVTPPISHTSSSSSTSLSP